MTTTLRKKEANEIAAVIGGEYLKDHYHMQDENGNKFFGRHDEWETIYDWFGRGFHTKYSFLNPPPEQDNQYVDIRVKEFLVSPQERETLSQQAHQVWFNDIMDQLDELVDNGFIHKISHYSDGSSRILGGYGRNLDESYIPVWRDYTYIHCPFADGSKCASIQKYFEQKMNAVPFYSYFDDIFKERFNTKDKVFKYKDKFFVIDDSYIREIELNKDLISLLKT